MKSVSTQPMPQIFTVCTRLPLKALCVITFAFLFLLVSHASSQTIMTVQHNNGYVQSATSVRVAFSSDVTSGNLILVAESSSNGVSLQTPTGTLGTTAGSPVPQSVATLGAGDSYTFTVSVPGSAGADGVGVAEKYTGTYTGGSFSASVRSVTLP